MTGSPLVIEIPGLVTFGAGWMTFVPALANHDGMTLAVMKVAIRVASEGRGLYG